MDSSSITQWLDSVMAASNVTGALLIDRSGLCLGVRGKATQADASFITIASRSALDSKGVGAVAYRGSKVIMRRGAGEMLVAVFKDVDDMRERPEE